DAVIDGCKTFEASLDSKLRQTIVIRELTGDTTLDGYLDDYEKSLAHLHDHFSKKYPASAEVADVLTRATTLDAFLRDHQTPSVARAWRTYSAHLMTWAEDYGATFPLQSGAAVRRIDDQELGRSTESLSKLPAAMKRSLDKAVQDTPAVADAATS